jgi:hypothetical protein
MSKVSNLTKALFKSPASAVSANGRWSGACGRVTGTFTVLLVHLFISVTKIADGNCNLSLSASVCVFITAVPIINLFAWFEGDSGGHVLRETSSRGLCGLVCPSRTNERGVGPVRNPVL